MTRNTPTVPVTAPTVPAAPRSLIPVTRWPEYHPWPTKAGLRALVFNADTNGFHRAFLKVGGRVLVDEVEFFAAIEEIAARRPLQRGNKRGEPIPRAPAGAGQC
ncbi:MAG: hypothetical protein KAX51_07230 [Chromatiaceae bacterium]|nr:hypothetical protein [Chromatiaceae bacterium]MBP8289579.1 hypothetical protein [Chromatiaceae bacterium]